MDADFWHARWTAEQIGFHQQDTNRWLQRYWPTIGLAPGSRVLVPLCGKSLDMHWLEQQGFAVAGIELSPLAVEAFFMEAGREPVRAVAAGHDRWSSGGIDLYCADFFSVRDGDAGHIDGFYDRAALVAMPPDLRKEYARHLTGLLPVGATGLLVTMEYDQAGMDGPPFPVPPDEVHALFSRAFDIEALHTEDVIEQFPAFGERGLGRLEEHVFRLARRGATQAAD